MLVKDFVHRKCIIISEESTAFDALKIFTESSCNGAVVVDSGDNVVGVVSMQDLAAKILPSEFIDNPSMAEAMHKHGFFAESVEEIKNKKIKDLMRTEFVRTDLEASIMVILADFLQNDLYLIPVIEDNKLVGVITRSDIRKAFAKAWNIG